MELHFQRLQLRARELCAEADCLEFAPQCLAVIIGSISDSDDRPVHKRRHAETGKLELLLDELPEAIRLRVHPVPKHDACSTNDEKYGTIVYKLQQRIPDQVLPFQRKSHGKFQYIRSQQRPDIPHPETCRLLAEVEWLLVGPSYERFPRA